MLQKTEIARETGWSEDKDDSVAHSHLEQDTPVDPSVPISAPAEDALLDAEDLVAPNQINTVRPAWRHPLPRTILAVMGTGIIGVGVLQLTEGNSLIGSSQNQADLNPTSTSIPKPVDGDKGDLQAQIATFELRQKINNINKARQAEKKSANITKVPTHPKPQPTPVAKPPQRAVAYNSPPQYISPPRATWVAARSQQSPKRQELQASVPKDPMEQWLAAANAGSFGSVSSASNTQLEGSSTSTEDNDAKVNKGIGSAPPNQKSDLMPAHPNPTTESLGWSRFHPSATSIESQPSGSTQTIHYSATIPQLIVGTKASGKLESGIAWSGRLSNNSQSFRIQLKEPLLAADNTVAVPKGAYLVARVDTAADSGLLEMSVVSFLLKSNGTIVEKFLPEAAVRTRAIRILGKGGSYLQAKATNRNNARNNIGMILLSGVSKVAALSNQLDYQSTYNDGDFTSTTTSRDPNYSAGLGQGAASELLRQQRERGQQVQQSIEREPNIFVLKQGTTVQVYVNQSLSLE